MSELTMRRIRWNGNPKKKKDSEAVLTIAIKDNESICSECGKKTNDDLGETSFDEWADPYCNECRHEQAVRFLEERKNV